MDDTPCDTALARIAAAIAEPARARMLCCLMDGHARTSTELSAVAGVSASTASVHLQKLKEQGLVCVVSQGKHRYHRLSGLEAASALEALMNLAGTSSPAFVPSAPARLRSARTCYDHLAGTLGVALHDRMMALGWLAAEPADASRYGVTTEGELRLGELGIELAAVLRARRRTACSCLDWSERRPHLGGALGAALLDLALARRWLERDLDSRALSLTPSGERNLRRHFSMA